ncbi:hypothetical protein Q3G72_032313 [Acer saccharum]|nr:hypothetical protein Q3G72_032313 [Acer saccharum]
MATAVRGRAGRIRRWTRYRTWYAFPSLVCFKFLPTSSVVCVVELVLGFGTVFTGGSSDQGLGLIQTSPRSLNSKNEKWMKMEEKQLQGSVGGET